MNLKGKKVLVTGGAGFIGSSLVKRLLIEGASVKVIDNLWRGTLENLESLKSHGFEVSRDFYFTDLTDYSKCLELIRDVDVVYHLADIVAGVDYVFSHEPFVFRQNILINSNVLWACITNKISNYIYPGTACSFPKKLQMAEGITRLHEDHTYPAEPETSYGWGKLMGEYEALLAQNTYKINVGLLRFHNVYGPGVLFETKRSQVIPSLIRKAILFPQEKFTVWGSGNQYRDFVYIDDVIDALILVLKRGMNKGLIQIGSEKATTLRELSENIVKISKKSIKIKFDISKPEGDRGRIGDCGRAKEILKWHPKVDINSGLEKTYKWIKQQIENQTSL